MLTIKQEKFIQNIVKGMSQREAYKNSYNAEKMKDESIDTKAWELMQKGEIRARYKELLQKIEDKTIMTAEERRKWLTKVISGEIEEEVYVTTNDISIKVGSKNADLTTKMKAMDMLNKMDGEYIDKLKISNDEDKPFEVNINVVK